MLKFAKLYETEVLKLSQELCLTDTFKWFNEGYISHPDIQDNDWDKIIRVSYYPLTNRVLGFLSAQTNRANGIITNVALWSVPDKSMSENKVFAKDLIEFILFLVKNFPTIQFCVTIGNPIQRRYRKFINYVGGNIVGITHNCVKVEGKLRDSELYEILSSKEVIDKLDKLKESI